MLTPLDIENREFKRTMSGYNRDDVEDFMGILLNDYEILYKQHFEMRERIKNLEAQILRLQSERVQAPQVSTFSDAPQTAESDESKIQAEKLVKDAQEKANAIIKEANIEIERLNRCYDESRKKMLDYREYMKTFLQAQLEVVEGIIEPGNEANK